mgnify:CR=1 FL=1|tara:strand:+ start:248 stop:580 length:333 start_codon:yes stop_codon:yes gene_type:complete
MPEESKLVEKLVEKQKEVKFDEKEIEKVKEIQKAYIRIQQSFGQLKLATMKHEEHGISLNEENDRLEENLKTLQDDEKKFLDGITEKYGQGTLNQNTGVFTPSESENKSE